MTEPWPLESTGLPSRTKANRDVSAHREYVCHHFLGRLLLWSLMAGLLEAKKQAKDGAEIPLLKVPLRSHVAKWPSSQLGNKPRVKGEIKGRAIPGDPDVHLT